MIKVVLADDHKLVRDGLRAILEHEEDIDLVAEAGEGREAINHVRRERPDVVLMDISMTGMDGIDATAEIKEVYPSTRVIILSMHSTKEHIYQALKAGARGFLRKETAGVEVVEAIRAVCRGHRYLTQNVTDAVIDDYVRQREEDAPQNPLRGLSAREREVMSLVISGKTTQEIADSLHLAPSTVSTYRSRLMKKLEVDNLAALVKLALKHGMDAK